MGTAERTVLDVPELMIGTHENFEYFHCQSCGSLSLLNIPKNIGWYYGQNYYSYETSHKQASKNILKSMIRTCSIRGKLGSSRRVDRLAHRLRPVQFHWMFPGSMGLSSRILDVGCGSGKLVQEMADYGFSNLTGIDPFLPKKNERPAANPRLLCAKMEDMKDGYFDVVMLHHVFEHLEDPEIGLSEARKLLSSKGRILIRVPVSDSYAFRKYGRFWVQIDAPRHIFVPSVSGVYALAKSVGLTVERLHYDSNEFQFVGSEAYLRGKSLYESVHIFSRSERKAFQEYSEVLNRIHDGDSACFWLRIEE